MIVTLCIAAIDPRLLDRALLAAAALADEGDALAVESLVAQGADVPAAILLRGEHRLVPRANEPSAMDAYHSAQTYVGGVVLDGERWLLVQTCRQNRVLLRGDVLRYEGRRAALRHRSNVVGAFLGALADAGVDLRTLPVRTFESEEPLRPWWAVHALPPAFLGHQGPSRGRRTPPVSPDHGPPGVGVGLGRSPGAWRGAFGSGLVAPAEPLPRAAQAQ